MRDRVALACAAFTAVLHLAVANRYDLFRDELYFIVCGRHPAFGYVDQPPLVPLLAAAGYALGGQTWIVRLPAVAAAVGLVLLVIALARTLGAGNVAATIAGLAAALAPIYLGLTGTLNTTTFEPFAWTFVAFALVRFIREHDRRWLIAAGIVAGLAMEAKYTLPLWLAALAMGLVATPERRIFRTRELWYAIAIAAVMASPSVAWQLRHGSPFVELIRNAHEKDVSVTPIAYFENQLLILNPFFAPIWIAGLVAPFAISRLRSMRFLAIAWFVAAVVVAATHGKDYYLAAAYPTLFSLGGIALAEAVKPRGLLIGYLTLASVGALAIAPLALPILPPATLIAYSQRLGLAPQSQERADAGSVLPPTFADMFGWHAFARTVGTAYDALPAAERARTSILVDNYGEAAALDVYGTAYHLPPALSGQNQYGLWALRGQRPQNLVRVQDHVERLAPYCSHVSTLAVIDGPYLRSFEAGKAVALCIGLHPSLQHSWPQIRFVI